MTSKPWQWQFPPIKKTDSLILQIGHLRSEVNEVVNAKLNRESNERLAEELMDVIHSAETTLRMLPFTDEALDGIKRRIVSKNEARGYYESE